jgi:Tfp pilus assembly protein PilO
MYQSMLSQNPIKSIRSSKNAVFTALVVIEAIALYNWIVTPHVNYLRAAQRYESVIDELAKRNQIINNNVTVKKKELEELQDKFRHVRIKLFDPVKAKEFFSDMQAMAEVTNCVIYSLNFSPTDSVIDTGQSEVSSHITANHATLSVVGGYRDIVALINKLQGRPRQVWVDSISIEPVGNNTDQLRCDIEVTIYVIHGKEKQSHD